MAKQRERSFRRNDFFRKRVSGFTSMGVGMVLCWYGLELGCFIPWGALVQPGPGLWPAGLGLSLAVLGVTLVFRPVFPSPDRYAFRRPFSFSRPVQGFLAAGGLWALLLTGGGLGLATILSLGLAARGAGNSPGRTLALVLLGGGGILVFLFLAGVQIVPSHCHSLSHISPIPLVTVPHGCSG